MTLEELNEAVSTGFIDTIIRVDEARQVKQLSHIADSITTNPDIEIVLIAGGSSSGKTTTAVRLETQLMVNGRRALHLSTDDYFVGNEKNPRDEEGNLDFEHIDCVDVPALVSDLRTLQKGGSIRKRKFDFVEHRPIFLDEELTLPQYGYVVIEGIHALNPRLTEGIDQLSKFSIYIDPKPNVDVFCGTYLTSRQARLIRRLVRDSRYRKIPPMETLRMWKSVCAGEDKWIIPFRWHADAIFNSYLTYEMCALKPYVSGLLERIYAENGASDKTVNNLRGLMAAVKAVDDVKIPGDSIIRETIGGSQLDY